MLYRLLLTELLADRQQQSATVNVLFIITVPRRINLIILTPGNKFGATLSTTPTTAHF